MNLSSDSGPTDPPLDTSDESDLDTEPLTPQPNPSQPWWNLPESRNSDPDGSDTEHGDDDDDDDDSYEDYVSDVVLQLGAGDNTISSDTEVEEPEDEPEDESENEFENQPSPRLDGGRQGVIHRPEGPVRRNLLPEFELQPPGNVRPPPAIVNGYNVGARGPVLPRPPLLQPPQQQPLPQQQQPPQPNQPGPELQPRHRPIRDQMLDLLGCVK